MIGSKYLVSLMSKADGVQQFLDVGIPAEWFVGIDAEAYDLVSKHVQKYHCFPTAEALAGIELPAATEDPFYYFVSTSVEN